MTSFEAPSTPTEKLDPYLYEVIFGDVLIATVTEDEAQDPRVVSANLESVPYEVVFDGEVYKYVTVGKKISVIDAFGDRAIPRIRDYQDSAMELYDRIKYMTVAQADVYLAGLLVQVVDHPELEKFALEAPEVAIVNGLLNGYADCCITFYIDTRFHDVPEPSTYDQDFNEWRKLETCTYLACPDCMVSSSAKASLGEE
jgi:hypothetical protein